MTWINRGRDGRKEGEIGRGMKVVIEGEIAVGMGGG
jgi:hypothetical protein